MSSSNLVRIAFIPEASYGVTPVSGNFQTARFISEGMSGSPDTVESQQIRTDRMSSGQVVTGLQVGGDLSFELAREAALDEFLASAMYNAWDEDAEVTVDMDIDTSAGTITRDSGSFITDGLAVGDFVELAGYSSAFNNTLVMVTAVTSATVIAYVGAATMVDATGTDTSYQRGDKLSIGTTKKSFTMEKAFLDLTNKAIVYKGMIASSFELNVAFGSLISGSFSFSGNSYQTVAAAANFATYTRTIGAAATTNTLNGSVDMPFLASAGAGALSVEDLKLQSVNISLDNNLSAQNVIGDIAPEDYSAGTAQIEVSLTAYLRDDAWAILAKKLTQDSFQVAFAVENTGGWYAFYMPAVQVSFDDPSSGGQNQDITLDMSGQAKVGSSGESALVIYRSPAA